MKNQFAYLFFVLWELAQGRWPVGYQQWLLRSQGDGPIIDVAYEDFDDDYGKDIEEGWLCPCGHYELSPFHCTHCGSEPPWGCDCGACEHWDDEDEWIEVEPGLLASTFDFADGDDEDEDDGFPWRL